MKKLKSKKHKAYKVKHKRRNDYKKVIEGLHPAWEELRRHPNKDTTGADGVSIYDYSGNYSANIADLTKRLTDNAFSFSPLKRATVEKGREILIQTVDERIVSEAILTVIHPSLEKLNSNHDFSRPVQYILNGEKPIFNGIPLAVKLIQTHFQNDLVWVLEADIKGFFDNVPKKQVFKMLEKYIKDRKVLALIRQTLYFTPQASFSKDAKLYNETKGIAQGSPMSPIFASLYLYEFDMFIVKNYPDVKLVRYVDDFIILCKDEVTARAMYDIVFAKLKAMGLEMYELGEKKVGTEIEKTKITCAKGYGAGAFDFLGLSFNYTDVDIRDKKKEEIKAKIIEVISSGNINFLQKTKSVESRLRAYIDQYNRPHYSRTQASLNKIIKFAQAELRRYYVTTYNKITHREPFKGLSDSTTENLFKFMGIDFNHILLMANSPRQSKRPRQRQQSPVRQSEVQALN